MELAHLRKESEEIDDSAIIPYERALSDEQRKVIFICITKTNLVFFLLPPFDFP